MVAIVLGLAGTVVVAHAALSHDHIGDMGDAIVMCVAVAETAAVAVGAALALGARMLRPLWLPAVPQAPGSAAGSLFAGVRARAGPPILQVFRL